MSGQNRRRYLTETVLDQDFLDWSQDNLDNKLQMVVDIETPTGTIYASDRNKYVDGTFYEALLVFPVIRRTVGEWLAPSIQFSQLELELANADGRFNDVMPHGANFGSWVGKQIIVKLGLSEVGSSYTTVFKGTITEVGGAKRSVKSITVIARDDYERLSKRFPNTALTLSGYPDLDDNLVGKILPVIYGDWTTSTEPDPAIVPAYPVNGKNANVVGGTRNNVEFRISENDLVSFDTASVTIKRGDILYTAPAADVVNVGAGNKTFELQQNTANLWVDGQAFLYETGDEFFVRCDGKDLGAYSDNIVWIARDMLITYGGAVAGDFDANWATYRDKNTPAQSNIAGFKCRFWDDEPKSTIEVALSLLEQVRLEAFVDRNLKLKISSLHFEDWQASPSHMVRNFDVVKDTFSPILDTRNNFNRGQGSYDFHPIDGENAKSTSIHRNQASVTQVGREISKNISFPNLYIEQDVIYQLIEILRLASSMLEHVEMTLTWRSLLQDIGDFAKLDVKIGGVQFSEVPFLIREIGYDPEGISIPVQGWSMAMCPFPGYEPGYGGTVGGYNATITEET